MKGYSLPVPEDIGEVAHWAAIAQFTVGIVNTFFRQHIVREHTDPKDLRALVKQMPEWLNQ